MSFKSFINELLVNKINNAYRVIGKDETEQVAIRFMIACIVIIYTSLVEHLLEIQFLSLNYYQ
mgnify:CR=1 FL=1